MDFSESNSCNPCVYCLSSFAQAALVSVSRYINAFLESGLSHQY